MEKKEADKEPKKKLAEERTTRLEKASLASLTARTMVWRVRDSEDIQSPKRKRDSDWLTTPTKRKRGVGGRVVADGTRNISLPTLNRTSHRIIILWTHLQEQQSRLGFLRDG